jgi:hypothetical protein
MGCKCSAERQPTRGGSATSREPVNDSVPTPGAVQFMKLANDEGDPVARKLLEEWSIFVYNHDAALNSGGGSTNSDRWTRPTEVQLSDTERLNHDKVDHVGRAFLEFMHYDLGRRSWGGAFTYEVTGGHSTGVIEVHVALDSAEQPWTLRVKYFAVIDL